MDFECDLRFDLTWTTVTPMGVILGYEVGIWPTRSNTITVDETGMDQQCMTNRVD